MAPRKGFEPLPPDSESGILPVRRSGNWLRVRDLNSDLVIQSHSSCQLDELGISGGIGWILTISLRLRRPALYTLSYNPVLAETERFERSQDFSRRLSGALPYQLGDISKLVQSPASNVQSLAVRADFRLWTLDFGLTCWRKGQDSNLQATCAVVFKTTALPVRLPFQELDMVHAVGLAPTKSR